MRSKVEASLAMSTSLGLGWVFLLSLLVAPAVFGQGASSLKVEADQGTLARWSEEETVSCGMDGRTWAALEDTCWYPVDLQRKPGWVEIARWREGQTIETAWLVVKEKEYPLQEIRIDDRYVHLSADDLAHHYRDQSEIKPIFRRRRGAAQFRLPLAQPLSPPVPEGRYFGVRRVFNGEPKNPHTGSDYAVGAGNPVKAVADGTVALTGENFFGGNSVFIYHGDGLVSMYLHLSEITVEKGQPLAQGDVVGKVGATGRATGPHLHLGLRWKGARIDPTLMFGNPEAVPAVAP